MSRRRSYNRLALSLIRDQPIPSAALLISSAGDPLMVLLAYNEGPLLPWFPCLWLQWFMDMSNVLLKHEVIFSVPLLSDMLVKHRAGRQGGFDLTDSKQGSSCGRGRPSACVALSRSSLLEERVAVHSVLFVCVLCLNWPIELDLSQWKRPLLWRCRCLVICTKPGALCTLIVSVLYSPTQTRRGFWSGIWNGQLFLCFFNSWNVKSQNKCGISVGKNFCNMTLKSRQNKGL